MKPDIYNGIAGLAADHGVEAAAEVAAFEAKHVTYLKQFIDNANIQCDYVVTKAVDVQLSQEHSEKLKDGYDRLIQGGCEPTANATYIDTPNAEKVAILSENLNSRTSAKFAHSFLGSKAQRVVSHTKLVTSGRTNLFCTFWKTPLHVG